MIQITPHMLILLAIEPINLRNGIDGLSSICRNKLLDDPFSGKIFVFRNRAGTSIKLLIYDGLGYWMVLRRFSKGKLKWWPTNHSEPITKLAARELLVILNKGIPALAQFEEEWRPLPVH